MEKNLRTPVSIQHICKASIFTSLGMISYFFLMKLFNLNGMLELRYLNFLLIFFAVRHVLLHKQTADGVSVTFHQAMMIGFITVFFTSALFSTFIFIYLNLDTTFMTMVQFSQPYGHYLTPASASFVTFLEGVASGAVIAIPVLRTMKKQVRTEMANETVSQLAN
jgi:hypothetical protein